VYDELDTIRDAIASTEHTWRSLCLLSLDFKDAFDNISHTYLFTLHKMAAEKKQRLNDALGNSSDYNRKEW
jgi:hypothetical protein